MSSLRSSTKDAILWSAIKFLTFPDFFHLMRSLHEVKVIVYFLPSVTDCPFFNDKESLDHSIFIKGRCVRVTVTVTVRYLPHIKFTL